MKCDCWTGHGCFEADDPDGDACSSYRCIACGAVFDRRPRIVGWDVLLPQFRQSGMVVRRVDFVGRRVHLADKAEK